MIRACLAFVVALMPACLASAAATTLPAVAAGETAWTLRGPGRTVTLSKKDLKLTIETGAATWPLLPSGDGDVLIEHAGRRVAMRFTDARSIAFAEYRDGYETGIEAEISGFAIDGKPLDLHVKLRVCLDHAGGDLLFHVVGIEGDSRLRDCTWPRGVEPKSATVTVVPTMQGMYLPRDWPKQVRLYENLAYSRALYMPWWGQQQGQSAMMVILETPDDAGCRFEHPAGGPTRIETWWTHSLGTFRYPRTARMCFFDKGDYVDMCQRYRRYALERGTLVSLAEKIAHKPAVARLIGSPVIHTSILYHIQPDSSYFDKENPAKNHQLVTFAARAEQLKKLAARGVGRAYVHVDGWGSRGYDNLHPDVLPPCPEAGGWDGMKQFSEAMASLGYLFAVHDNYRDYYRDAASFSERFAVQNEDGSHPSGSTWYGGAQSILCSDFAPGHVSKNHRALLAHGVKLDGAYLDVFSIVPGDECYNPEHPASRADSLRRRARCLALITELEGIASSEEPCDWAIPFIDLVHHGPYALDPNPGGGPAYGIPVPLFNLVYHDAILLPWTMTKGGWGIPDNDWGYLHALLNGGLPYLDVEPKDEDLQRVRTACALGRRVGLAAMTSHEFLDGPDRPRRQRTRFADGTSVTVDFDHDTFDIAPPLTERELAEALAAKP